MLLNRPQNLQFPLQDTDPEDSSSAASTALRQDISVSIGRQQRGVENGDLSGEVSAAVCTCEDGEVREFCPNLAPKFNR